MIDHQAKTSFPNTCLTFVGRKVMRTPGNASLKRGEIRRSSRNASLPTGRQAKILSSGWIIFLRVGVTFTIKAQSSHCKGTSLVQGQAEVAAIRFSPTFLPDLNESTEE